MADKTTISTHLLVRCKNLSDGERLEIFDNIILVALHQDDELALSGGEIMFKEMLLQDVADNRKSYERRCLVNSNNRNGLKTRPDEEDDSSILNIRRKKYRKSESAEKTDSETLPKNDLEEESDTTSRQRPKTLSTPKRIAFTKPTIDECKNYAVQSGMSEKEGEKFWNFYESKNWMIGKNKMANWKIALGGTWKHGLEKLARAFQSQQRERSNHEHGF